MSDNAEQRNTPTLHQGRFEPTLYFRWRRAHSPEVSPMATAGIRKQTRLGPLFEHQEFVLQQLWIETCDLLHLTNPAKEWRDVPVEN